MYIIVLIKENVIVS